MTEFTSAFAEFVSWVVHALPAVLLIFLKPFLDAMEITGSLDKKLFRSFFISLLAGLITTVFVFFVLDQFGFDPLQGLWIAVFLIWSVEGAAQITACVAYLFVPDFRAVDSTDPLVDVTKLSPEFIEPIRAGLENFKSTPLFERRVRRGWIDFGFRIPRLRRMSESELRALYVRYTELAAASERTVRQQTAEMQAREARDLAQSRADFLASKTPAERGLLAVQLTALAEADARAAHETERLETENAELRQTLAKLQNALAAADIRATVYK